MHPRRGRADPAPARAAQLAQHDLIANAAVSAHNRWPFDDSDALSALPVAGRIQADNTAAVVSMTLAGLGIGRINKVIAQELVGRGSLVQVLADHEDPTEFEISAVTLAPRNRLLRISTTLEFLSECFRAFRQPAAAG